MIADGPIDDEACRRWCFDARQTLDEWGSYLAHRDRHPAARAEELEDANGLAASLLDRLQQLMRRRHRLLEMGASRSLQDIAARVESPDTFLMLELRRLQDEFAALRRHLAARWLADQYEYRLGEQLLFILRSGEEAPATYCAGEATARDGGVLLDSTA